ncbi:MAG: MBL fold metallo-hydrolase [Bilophila sp.]
MPVATFPLGPLDTNCHVVYNNTDAVVVDPGGDMSGGLGDVLALLTSKKLTVQAIVCTHFHFDHIYGVAALAKATGAAVYAPNGDEALLQTEVGGGGAWGFPQVTPFTWNELKEGTQTFGSISFEVLATPGHTPGSISLYLPDMKSVLTGDVLFFHSVGRTDFPGSSPDALRKSLHKKIFVLPPDTEVYPGHGPNTNVGEELANNPYLWL